MLYLYKLNSTFYYDYLEKPILIFLPINSALPIARPLVRPIKALSIKQKYGQSVKTNGTHKHIKKS